MPAKTFPLSAARVGRRGMILPVVLVALLVVALIGAAMSRTVLLQRRSARQAEQQQQAAWLADSAMLRARSRLAEDEQYAGEHWEISAEQMGTGYAGTAMIRIESAADGTRILVEAAYPMHPVNRILERREHHVKSSRPGGS